MEKFPWIELLVWPASFLVVAIVFLLVFRKIISKKLTGISSIDGKKISFSQSNKSDNSSDLFNINPELLEGSKVAIAKMAGLNGINNIDEKYDSLLDFSTRLAIAEQFNYVHREIFGTQITLLQRLNSADNDASNALLREYYEGVEKLYPIFKEQYSFDEYLNFLVTHGLIGSENGKEYFLTQTGQDFLSYLIIEGLAMEKEF